MSTPSPLHASLRQTLSGLRRSVQAAALLAAAAAIGCAPPQDYDAKPVLLDLVQDVMLPVLSDVAARSKDLSTAADALAADPTEETLSATQAAWRAAREPWRRTDAFSFGPVVDQGLGASIDWWPAKPATIDEKIASGAAGGAAYIDSLGTSAKGFMALEYLLFDSAAGDGAVLAALSGDTGAPRRAFAAALAANLAGKTEALRLAWDEAGGKYALEVTEAGEGSRAFTTRKAAVDELVNQMVFQADTLLNARIGKPAGKSSGGDPLPDTEESPRSDNSLADMLASLGGLSAIYEGKYGDADGLGLSDLVKARSPAVDDRVRQAFGEARSRIEAIPPPFRTAIFDHEAEVTAAYESTRKLKRELATEVVSALGSTLRFNDADGD